MVALAVLAGTVVSAAASGQESTGEVVVRIVARKLAGGKVEFGLQQRRGDDAWGERMLPRVRLFPATARVDRWLASSALALAVGDVRIVARRLAGGKVEFGLQRRGGDDAWGERMLPRVRLFPTTARVDRWLASSALALRDPPAGSATEPPTGPPAAPSDGAHDPGSSPVDARLLIDIWSSAVSATRGVWPGFDLASIPAVLAAIDDERAIGAAVAFNHPNPQALGAPARTLHVDGHRIVVIGEVADPDWLAAQSPYQLTADVGGTDTFVLIGEESDEYYDPETPLFIAYLAHEAFHRYQSDEWTSGTTRQYFDHYDYSVANLELVLLENRILVAAYRAEDPGDLQRLARQFAAVRATRHERDYRVAHDEEQERIEGSARFIEHRIGETIGAVHATSTNHPRDLEQITQILATAPELLHDGIKVFFSLARFYSSGATLLVLLERLGASDVVQQLQDGRTPARLLARHVVPLGDLDELVAGARADHDPDDRLAAAAATLHGLALDEPATGLSHDDSEFILTDAQIGCLEAFGMEFSDTPVFGNRIGIPPNAAHSCLAGAMLGLTAAQIACLEAHGIDVSDALEAGDRIIITDQAALDCLNDAGDPDGASP